MNLDEFHDVLLKPVPYKDQPAFSGISTRDWFAMNATEHDIEKYMHKTKRETVCVSDPSLGIGGKRLIDKEIRISREQARYEFADAMILARGELSWKS